MIVGGVAGSETVDTKEGKESDEEAKVVNEESIYPLSHSGRARLIDQCSNVLPLSESTNALRETIEDFYGIATGYLVVGSCRHFKIKEL